MICKKCGAESPDGSKVCMMCGTPFSGPTICPNCGAAVAAQAAFCPTCGQKLNAPAKHGMKPAKGGQKHTVRNILIGVAIVFAILLFFGGSDDSDTKKQSSPSQPTTSSSQKADADKDVSDNKPAKEEKPISKSGSAMTGSGDLGDSYVEIKGAELGKNYSDEPIIIVTYAWTNNSDETTSAMVSTSEQAFQDGVELDHSISAKDTDFSNNSKDVRPGKTIDIKCAFVLANDTSTVEFEIKEWISFSDEKVTMDFDPANLE